MSKKKRDTIGEPDEFDIVSAIWVMASNDETPMITYEGIRYRMRLSDTFDVRALVRKRPDLFRQGASKSRLENWKNDMRSGKRLPSWIRDIENEQDRRARIDSLTTGDMFRSQFRTEADAPRSSIEVIDWGLQHIDRLRKARVEALETRYTSWQLWSVIILGILNVIATTSLTIITAMKP